jgi:hypothetical protein
MLGFMEKKQIRRAMEVADTIDWRRVKNPSMLYTVSEIYEQNEEYQKSRDVLYMAYNRAPSSKKILYKMVILALRIHDVDEATECYEEFVKLTPKDPNQYIMKYRILKEKNAPIREQISALEDFKKAEYVEKWAFELAKLYSEAGMTAECLEECDDLILWFSDGRYVYSAMELKMKYKPLTPLQREKYTNRYGTTRQLGPEIPERDSGAVPAKAAAAPKEKTGQTGELKSSEISYDGYTLEEDDAKESYLNDHATKAKAEDFGETGDMTPVVNIPKQRVDAYSQDAHVARESEVPASQTKDEAIREVKETFTQEIVENPVSDINEETPPAKKAVEAVTTEAPVAVETAVTGVKEAVSEAKEAEVTETKEVAAPEIKEATVTEPAPVLEEAGTESTGKIVGASSEEDYDLDDYDEEVYDIGAYLDAPPKKKRQVIGGESLEDAILKGVSLASGKEIKRTTSKIVSDEPGITGQMRIDEILKNWEEKQKVNAKAIEEQKKVDEERLRIEREKLELERQKREEERIRHEEELVQKAREERARQEAEQARLEQERLEQERIEKERIERERAEKERLEAQERERERQEWERVRREHMEKEAKKLGEVKRSKAQEIYDDFLNDDDDVDVDETQSSESISEENETGYPETESEYSEAESEDTEFVNEGPSAFDAFDDATFPDEQWDDDYSAQTDLHYEEEHSFEPDSEAFIEEDNDMPAEFDEDEFFADYNPDGDYEDESEEKDIFEEDDEKRRKAYEKDLYDEPDYDDDEDESGHRRRRSHHEHESEHPDERTEHEIRKRMRRSKNGIPFDTGFVVTGRYDLNKTSEIGLKAGLTEEQKKLFSYFVPVRGMSEQIVEVLDNDRRAQRDGTSKVGNILIIGKPGTGKTVLAMNTVKAIQKQRNLQQGKVSIITGESLNKKDLTVIIQKLRGGAIIVEKAGRLNSVTVKGLNTLMEKKTGELLFVFEDQKKPLEKLMAANPEFKKKFTSKLEVPVFLNDDLVTFGQTYAKENGYKLDEMSILALYSRIDVMQREDHHVSVAEVKEILDEAIARAQKSKVKRLTRKREKSADDTGLIILKEEDFKM